MKNRTIQKVNKRQSRKKAKVIHVLEEIKNNYNRKEESLIAELNMRRDNHQTTIGSFREQVWADLFRQLLPKKFSIQTNGFIIGVDSSKNPLISPEIDIIIFDEYYVPYIFQFGETAKIIPVEAVIAVVQCKGKEKGDSEKWLKNVERIKPSVESAKARQYSGGLFGNEIKRDKTETYRKTRPISIFCSTASTISKNFDLNIGVIENKLVVKSKLLEHSFEDIAKYLNEEGILSKSKKVESKDWEQFERVENGMLKLSLVLNQLTMLINNPLIFDHQAYAKMFAKKE